MQLLVVFAIIAVFVAALSWPDAFESFRARAAEMVNDIQKATREVKIEAGELCPRLYNNPRVAEAIREAVYRGVRVKVMAGPVISVDKNTRENKIVNLAKEGLIEFYLRKKRQTTKHYRVIDNLYVIPEVAHEPNAGISKRRKLPRGGKEEAKDFEAEFDEKIARGEAVRMTAENFGEGICFLTISETDKVVQLVKQAGKKYDPLTLNELDEYIQKVRAH